MLGNPLVYWGSTFSLVAFAALVAWYGVRWQRGYKDLSQADIDHIHYSALYPVIGWFLHYLPFLIMARVTYVHHYYPALYFAILCAGFMVDWTTRRLGLGRYSQFIVYAPLYGMVTGLYFVFRQFWMGIEGSHTQLKHLKWFEQWKMTD